MANKLLFCAAVAVALLSAQAQAQAASASDCELPKEKGTCNQNYPSYYFDMRTRVCRPFVWSGCGGNGNKFFSRKECQFACHYFMKLKHPVAELQP